MNKHDRTGTDFLQWALPELGYRWRGFRKPRAQVLQRIIERIHELELSGYKEYQTFLEHHPDEWKRLDQMLYVTISRFYRDRKLWDELATNILPRLVEGNAPELVVVWSAGCCNGEEPYSIAIAAHQSGMLDKITIIASDRYPHLLERAKIGLYPESALRELTPAERSRYFTYNDKLLEYRIDPVIRSSVHFEERNIRHSLADDFFHIIFCRNLVFTYFNNTEQIQLLAGFRNSLFNDGYLITGSKEQLPEEAGWIKPWANVPVYRKAS